MSGRVALYGATDAEGSVARLKHFVVEGDRLFARAVGKARAVLLVGGTLSPRAGLVHGLLGRLDRGKIREFECEHVVPRENVMTRICGTGPCGTFLEFTYENRGQTVMAEAAGHAVAQLVQRTRGGVVVF